MKTEKIEKTCKKIEIYDEDQGWILYCENCGWRAEVDEEYCEKCKRKFSETERV